MQVFAGCCLRMPRRLRHKTEKEEWKSVMGKIRIGTRKSRLALLQTQMVCEAIQQTDRDVKVEIVPMSTKGDEIQDVSLLKLGGKGIFTKELEEALLSGEIDMAVHSAKDIPLELPEGLCISPVLDRGDPSDVILTCSGLSLQTLPKGAVVGSSSLRRQLQAKKINPRIRTENLRGNIQTRIQKMKQGQYDAIILASAGIERLRRYYGDEDLQGVHLEYMNPQIFLPAAGQGILALEHRKGDFADLLGRLKVKETEIAYAVERDFLRYTEAGCNAHCGIYCSVFEEKCCIDLMYVDHCMRLCYEHIEDGEAQARESLRLLALSLKRHF